MNFPTCNCSILALSGHNLMVFSFQMNMKDIVPALLGMLSIWWLGGTYHEQATASIKQPFGGGLTSSTIHKNAQHQGDATIVFEVSLKQPSQVPIGFRCWAQFWTNET